MLSVPFYRQKRKSPQCVPCCLRMLFEYYRKPHPLSAIIKGLPLYRNGTYTAQIGTYLMKHGFDATLITLDPHAFVKKDYEITQKEKISRMEKIKMKSKRARSHYLHFLRENGNLIVKIPTLEDIRKEIKARRPVIALMTTEFIFAKKPRHNGHAVIITGIDSTHVYVNDPSYQFGGKKKYTHEDFLYGLYARRGAGVLITAKPKKKKQAL